MATLAAPQPSFSCFTNGMSSQMPEGSAAKSTPQTPSIRTTILLMLGNMGWLCTHRDNDQNESGDGNQDNNQVPVAEIAGGEVGLRLVHPRCQLCQLGVTKASHRILHPFRVCMRGLQRLLCLLRGEKLLHSFQILLPYPRGIHSRFLQFRGTHYVFGSLREEVL